ncbi:MAG TPA: tetratricopeptide repeat protein, partial [Gammaproteobacteria bacterium]
LDAINAYKHALNLRPLFSAAYNNMGNALMQLGKGDQAQTCYENVLEIEPGDDRATRHLAQVHAAGSRFQVAEALYQRLLAHNPQDVDALGGLAACLINAGNQEGAIETLQRVMAITPSAAAPRFLLDALCGNARQCAPPEYIQSLFDGYADRFELEQTVSLGYRGPAELRELFGEAVPADSQYSNALDVGCGTGLAAAAFKSLASRFTGIDLSSEMLVRAGQKHLYDSLLNGEAVELLTASEGNFDLVLCCDTLAYVGDPVPLFEAVAARTLPGGHFLCSTELAGSGTYSLQPSARFAHCPDYVIECASAAGFDVLAHKTIALRKAGDGWTSGGIYCFVRRA